MSLLFPLGMIALIALPIILLLHLLRERRRRVTVPSLLLWQNMPRRPDGRRSSVLPLSLLLLLHLLVALLVALALAQPQLLSTIFRTGGQQIVLIIDTSTSMAAQDGGRTRLAAAQNEARTLINRLGANDQLAIIAMNSHAHVLARGGSENQQELLGALNSLQAGGATNLAEALTLAEASLDPERQGQVIILSDNALLGTSAPKQVLSADLRWQQIGSNQGNKAIVSFAAQNRSNSRTAPIHVYARVANYANQSSETWARLIADGQQIDERFVEFPANGEAELTWTVPAGTNQLSLEIQGNDALAIDDVAQLSLAQVRPLRILLVSEQASAAANNVDPQASANSDLLRRALNAVPGASVGTIAPAQYTSSQSASQADLTVFEEFLPEAWPAGGVLVIAPPRGNSLIQVQDTRPISTTSLRQRGSLLSGLNLDTLRRATVAEIDSEWGEVLLSDGETPLIARQRIDQSEIAVWAFSLRDTNLPTRLAFPLLVARSVRDLTPQALPNALNVGDDLRLQPSPRASTISVSAPDGQTAQYEGQAELLLENLNQAGFYSISELSDDGSVLYNGRVAVNIGNPSESDLRSQDLPEISTAPLPVSASSEAESSGRELWPVLTLLALAVLFIEWIYVHR
jgi:Ca-activated chloride channel family protein